MSVSYTHLDVYKRQHSALVQLIIPAALNTQTEFVIPDQQLLRFARVTAIECFCAEDVAAVFPGSTPLIDGQDLKKCVLTLNTNNALSLIHI